MNIECILTPKTQTDDSLEVINGSDREYYQVRLSNVGKTGDAHCYLRQLARTFFRIDERRLVLDQEERDHGVAFKLMSYDEPE